MEDIIKITRRGAFCSKECKFLDRNSPASYEGDAYCDLFDEVVNRPKRDYGEDADYYANYKCNDMMDRLDT